MKGIPYNSKSIHNFTDVRFNDVDYDYSFDPSNDASTCAKGSTFCERIDSYPSSELNSILKETVHKYEGLFGSDFVPEPITIGNRFSGSEDEPLCASQVRLVFPKAAVTKDNTWRFIVNHSNYTQGVRVEECM